MMTLIVYFTSVLLFKLIFDWYFNFAHERTHARIYENDGIKYTLKITPFNSWCDGERETKATIRDHNMTEIVGYHSKVIFDLIYYALCVIVLIMVVI